ncbi:hypothetical protein QR680_014699 [Steinernema hermaphroditum]|uniref:Uncharacterized protein n=1 Tax=Steinernema hermaphroditum TaxID=289476 RepID=A0AA39M4D6_9BILA|nr:hypothetical protein QR680_014699 [Steinernema hermaphroditum]
MTSLLGVLLGLVVLCSISSAYPKYYRRNNYYNYNNYSPRYNNGYGNYNYYNNYNPYRNYYNNGYGNYNYYNRNYNAYGAYSNYNRNYNYNPIPPAAPATTGYNYNPNPLNFNVPGLKFARGGGYVDSAVGRLWLFCDGISGCGHGRG